eukprot:Clim_evm5s58 gene=Clim_evmTU5s58
MFDLIGPAVSAGLSTMVAGYCLSFTSPALQPITDEFQLSDFESSTYSGALSLAAAVGALGSFFVTRHYGPYRGQILASIIMTLGWAIQAFAPNFAIILLGRIITGIALGITTACTPLFLNDSAPEGREGAFGFVVQVGIGLGILLINVFGLFAGWRALGWICAGTSGAAVLAFLFSVPTPPRPVPQDATPKASSAGLAPYIISIILMVFQQMSGINVIIFYINPIAESAGLDDPEIVAVYTMIVQLASGILSLLFIDKVGKKVLLFASSFGMMSALVMLASFFFIQDEELITSGLGESDDEEVNATSPGLALAAIFIFIFSFNCGLGPIPWSVVGEYFEPHQIGAATTGIANYLLAFGVTQSVSPMLQALGGGATYMFYAAFCFASCVFTVFIFPRLQRYIDDARREAIVEAPSAASLPEKKEHILDHISGIPDSANVYAAEV